MSDEQTIAQGYPPEAHRVVCVDFDGVLYPFGFLYESPEPMPGARRALTRLRQRGYRIVIFTSRLSPSWLMSSGHSADEQRAYISRLLYRDGIPFDDLTAEKVPAVAYLDDRAIRVRSGELDAAVDWLLFEADVPA